jgi:hypothetical protein
MTIFEDLALVGQGSIVVIDAKVGIYLSLYRDSFQESKYIRGRKLQC